MLRSLKLQFPRIHRIGVGFGDWLERWSRDNCQALIFESVGIYFTRCLLILKEIWDIDWTGLGDLGLIHYDLRREGRQAAWYLQFRWFLPRRFFIRTIR